MSGDLTIKVDPDGTLIRVHGTGLFTREMAVSHFAKLRLAIKDMRDRFGGSRILVDFGDASVQSSEIAAMLQDEGKAVFNEHDLVAVLCRSTLQKLQVRRNAPQGRTREFEAHQEAEAVAWLREIPLSRN